DEASAKAFLLERGLLGKVRGNRALAENAFAVDHDYPTHWVLALHIVTNANPAENGHIVFGWPKSRFTSFEIDQQIASILGKFNITQVRPEAQSPPHAN